MEPIFILYADDDPDDQEAFIELVDLIDTAVQPLLFGNGRPLINYLETLPLTAHLPTCIVLDINMPIFDGYQTLTIIRTIPRFLHLPVVMLTTSDSNGERERCLKLGATEFLLKPHNTRSFKTVAERLRHFVLSNQQ